MNGDVQRGQLTAEIIETLCELRGEPVITTHEVARISNLPEMCAEEKLEVLKQDGELGSKRISNGRRIWWLSK